MKSDRGTPGPSRRITVADGVRRDILAARLEPGARIPAVALQAAYGVSASAVREALCKLAVDGLVVSEDRRGFRVAPASASDLNDVATARTEIESFALRDAIHHGDKAWEAGVVAALHRLSRTPSHVGDRLNDLWFDEHRAFHDALVAGSQSAWMKRFRTTIHDQFERYCRLCASLNARSNRAKSEHVALVKAALARDADEAVRIMHEHIWGTARACLKAGIGDPASTRRVRVDKPPIYR